MNIKFLAYYLPQYHPIPENDKWWGKGFTEWTNVTKAKPLFKGHYQPILPADLGFYDLRVPEVQEQQAQMAKAYGIDGFIYYHYWFGNSKMLLEKPAELMLKNLRVDLPFCFCWANESWKGIWHGLSTSQALIEQEYLGKEDIVRHFNYLLPFLKDDRYIKIEGKPMIHIYKPMDIPNTKEYLKIYNQLAIKNGFKGLYFVSNFFPFKDQMISDFGLDAQVGLDLFYKVRYVNLKEKPLVERMLRYGYRKLKISKLFYEQFKNDLKEAQIYDYKEGVEFLKSNKFPEDIDYFPCIIPNWDNTSRAGDKALIFNNANPELWGEWVKDTICKVNESKQREKIIIIKSWNEWAEGNYLEPCQKFGLKWLEEVRKAKEIFKV